MENKHDKPSYFNLTNYFASEAHNLKLRKQKVKKEVSVNGKAESKTLSNLDWEQEFKIFTENEINKADWNGEFKIAQVGDTTVYQTNNKKIPVKELRIVRSGNQVQSLRLITVTKNYLYQSVDTLWYAKDQGYKIINTQKVRLLKPKRYLIQGILQ